MLFRLVELLMGLVCLVIAACLIVVDVKFSTFFGGEFETTAIVDVDRAAEEESVQKEEDIAALPQITPTHKVITVKRGDSLGHVLSKLHLSDMEQAGILKISEIYFRKHKIKPDQKIIGVYNSKTQVIEKIILFPNNSEKTEIARKKEDPAKFSIVTRPLAQKTTLFKGVINSSFSRDAQKSGINQATIRELIRLFSYSIDFQRGVKKGDTFSVLVERFYDEETGTEFSGDLVYAKFDLKSSVLAFYRFTTTNGGREYYNEKGEGVVRALLKTPIDGARISSRFGLRQHPILGYSLMHRGVDFSARVGTPIMAAGDGLIERAGRFGSYGHYIRIRHNKEYSTAYAHLSRYANGIKSGKRVKQGEVIGYVGTSGRTTSAHLHYEVLNHGKQINPQTMKIPSQKKLTGAAKCSFEKQKKNIDVELRKYA